MLMYTRSVASPHFHFFFPPPLSAMALIYSLVARGSTILAEFTESSGNFTTITQSILDKIAQGGDQKCTYVYDRCDDSQLNVVYQERKRSY